MKKHGNAGNKNAVKESKLDAGYAGRCTKEDKARWVNFAQSRGMSLQQLMTISADSYIDSAVNSAQGKDYERKDCSYTRKAK